MRIALSAGHGFSSKGEILYRDPGAVNDHYQISEADIVGNIQKSLINIFDSSSIELVEIPRASLVERIKIINCLHLEKAFDLAVEIHLNASLNPSISGSEVLYFTGSQEGEVCASLMVQSIVQVLGSRNRGIKPRNDLAFLRDTIPPSVITEAEFLSSDEIAERLSNGVLEPLIVIGHALGFCNL